MISNIKHVHAYPALQVHVSIASWPLSRWQGMYYMEGLQQHCLVAPWALCTAWVCNQVAEAETPNDKACIQ